MQSIYNQSKIKQEKRMFKFLSSLLITSLLFLQLANAQQNTVTVSGQLIDENKNPLAYSNVMLENTNKGDVTDENGNFKIQNVKFGEYTLRISSVGYETTTQNISVSEDNQNLIFTIKEDVYQLPQLTVIGAKDRLFSKIPGSVAIMDKKEIAQIQPVSGNEVFRRIPGLHVVDEEGLGMRLNVGIRGLNPDRSRNVLVLEDGVPIALNPYGEPELYYTPAIDRMESVEVLKGSGQIQYGPQTIGGVINFITPNAPSQEEIRLKAQGGQGGFFSGLASYGNTFGNTGVIVSYLRKQGDAVGPTDFTINDLNAKVNIVLGSRSRLGLKISGYDETSNSTYVGITQTMFDNGGNDYSVLAPNDELAVSRYGASINHAFDVSAKFKLQSSVYANTTTRNWRRQNFTYSDGTGARPGDFSGLVWGDESVAGGALLFRNGTGNRNRTFEVGGWEEKIVYKEQLNSNWSNELTAGFRLLYERAFEQRINGSNPTALSGSLINDEIRTGNAISFYASDKISFTNKFDISLGLRAEQYNYQREILRASSEDTYETAENNIFEIIPGIGANYRLNSKYTFFAGIHRGYAPPRIKDAIDFSLDNPVIQLEAEQSWNTEIGVRAMPIRGIYAEFTYFYMDFQNQIVPSSESVGGVGFGLINAGETLHKGLEISVNTNSKELAGTDWNLLFDVNATYVNATFSDDRFVEEININGNATPYAPNWTISSALALELPFGTGVRLTNTYVSDQYTDQLNTVAPSNNGRIGLMDAYNILDATIYHKIPKWNAAVNLSVKNLTDERYISTRNPEGIRVGLPRFITAGIDLTF